MSNEQTITEFIEKENEKWPWWKYMFDIEPSKMNPNTDYRKEVLTSLIRLKLVLLIGLIIISLIYQIYYIAIKKKNKTKTYANGTYQSKLSFGLEIIITFCLSMLSIIFLYWSRMGFRNMREKKWQVLYHSFIISIVITVFAISQELSGYNRWSSNSEGEYEIIDDKLDNHEDNHEKNADENSFFMTLAIFCGIIFISVFLVYSLKILIILGYAFKKNKSSIKDISRIFGRKLSDDLHINRKWLYFILELIIVSILFCIPFVVSPYIRKERYTFSRIMIISIIIFITILLQIGFQYTNLNPV